MLPKMNTTIDDENKHANVSELIKVLEKQQKVECTKYAQVDNNKQQTTTTQQQRTSARNGNASSTTFRQDSSAIGNSSTLRKDSMSKFTYLPGPAFSVATLKPGTSASFAARSSHRNLLPPPIPQRPPPMIPPKPRRESSFAAAASSTTVSSCSSCCSTRNEEDNASVSLDVDVLLACSFANEEVSILRTESNRVVPVVGQFFIKRIRRSNTWPKCVSSLNTKKASKYESARKQQQGGANKKLSRTWKLSDRRPRTLCNSFLSNSIERPNSLMLLRPFSYSMGDDRDSLFSSSRNSDSDFDVEDQNRDEESKLFMSAKEFSTTENSYLAILDALCNQFPKFIEKESHNLRRPLVQPELYQKLSFALTPLFGVHKKLAESFQQCILHWNPDSPGLAKVLMDIGPFIKMSGSFLQQKSFFTGQLIDACKKYPDFAAAVQVFERQKFGGLLMIYQLDSVHQRICRYPLLLSAYMKHLDHSSQEYQKALEAKKVLEAIATDVENCLGKNDDTRILLELQRRIQSRYEIIQPGRKLLKEGEILKHSRKELQSRVLILFNDVLLYCAPVMPGHSNLWVRNEFDLASTSLSIPQHVEQKLYFHIIGKKRSIIVMTKSSEERSEWTNAIEEAKKEIRRKSEFLQQEGQCSPTDSSPTSKLGKFSPVWIPDSSVTMCQNCQTPFTKLRRRHHCRSCGKVICGYCCGEAPLEYANFESQIVCPLCYKILREQIIESDFVSYGGIMQPGPDAVVMNKLSKSLSRQSIVRKFKAPKNGIFEETLVEEGFKSVEGNLSLYEKKSWTKYWVVLRETGVLEFYSARGDPVCKKSVVLLSFDVREVSVVNGGEQIYFDLVHSNQFATKDSNEVKYSFKAENLESAERWQEGIRRIKENH